MSDPVGFQRHIAAVLLEALEGTDFALAGSGAIREHGITERPTQDFDLFARLLVESAAGDTVEVDLGVDWRKEPPFTELVACGVWLNFVRLATFASAR